MALLQNRCAHGPICLAACVREPCIDPTFTLPGISSPPPPFSGCPNDMPSVQNASMNKLVRPLLPIVAVAALFAPSASQAWWGGPFGLGFPSADGLGDPFGTYQAVISGKNVSGIAIFGIAGTSDATTAAGIAVGLGSSGNDGRFALFVDGEVVIGGVSAVGQVSSKQIGAVLEGSKDLGQEIFDIDLITTTVENQVTITATTTDETLNVTTNRSTKTLTLNKFIHVAGDFLADLDLNISILSFEGDGSLVIEKPTGEVDVHTTTTQDVVSDETGVVVPIFSTVTDTTKYSRYTPVLETSTVAIRVDGARTSFASPSFGLDVITDHSSVQ